MTIELNVKSVKIDVNRLPNEPTINKLTPIPDYQPLITVQTCLNE